ncbi:hypothetical protein [Haloprofundus salilacus]|uniref:hypothetical protein n=1 Tax=Haloprofundus salilacus TaxID=2876190 RepID=UPI001CCE6E39|nr:hypothetical protein [Haloprofundus salilacus]
MIIDKKTQWWRIHAGKHGELAKDWLEQNIITIGWADDLGDFREQTEDEFVNNDTSPRDQVSRFVGFKDNGMQSGEIAVVYAPKILDIVGVGRIGEPMFLEEQPLKYAPKARGHRYIRPIEWFGWDTPVPVSELPSQFHLN